MPSPQPIRLPIRQLVEFLLRTGSIDSRGTLSPARAASPAASPASTAPTREHASTAGCKKRRAKATLPRSI